MPDVNGWGVNVAAVVPGARIRLADEDGERSMGTVTAMDSPTSGRIAVYDPIGGHAGESALFHVANVTGAGLVCAERGALPAPCWWLDFIDFPTGWHLQRQGVVHVDHRCSAVQTWDALLCDCGAIETEWNRRRELMGRGVVRERRHHSKEVQHDQ